MRRNNRRLAALVMTIMALTTLAVLPTTAQEPASSRGTRAEVRFMEGMIDHHQMALDMAEGCLTTAETEAVRAICQNVIDTQTGEIETLRGWLRDWYGIDYVPMPMVELMELMGLGEASGMAMGHGDHTADPARDMPLMMGMMAGLDRVKGIDYEIAWLEAMIDHHDDALHMSQRILRRSEREELRVLAQQIIDAQTAEIEEIEALIVELGGES